MDDLVRMVQEGFGEARADRDSRFKGVDKQFKEVNRGLDRIENTLLKNHEERIKRLEKALSL